MIAAGAAALALALLRHSRCWALLAGVASAHARVSPAVSLAGELQLYTPGGPDREGGREHDQDRAHGPAGFSIDSFAPSPGWQRVAAADG